MKDEDKFQDACADLENRIWDIVDEHGDMEHSLIVIGTIFCVLVSAFHKASRTPEQAAFAAFKSMMEINAEYIQDRAQMIRPFLVKRH